MRLSSRSVFPRVAAIALAVSFALSSFAESPRQELVHASILLKLANNDYGGHRIEALHEVEAAGRELGLRLRGEGSEREHQFKSDEHLREARRLLVHAREKLQERDRDRVAARVENAIREIDAALASVAVITPPVRLETPREELVHAYFLLKHADHDYADHRIRAMREIEAAGKHLGLDLHGDGAAQENQFKSDERLAEARRLLRHAREQLEERDRDRVAARVDKAIREIDAALRVK